MIYGFTHPGSGLGNQLHRYVATRVLALDKGYDFTMLGAPALFKGKDFMNLDFGKTPIPHPIVSIENGGKLVVHENIPLWEERTNYYNPEFNFIEDNTILDGEFQDERYFGHRIEEIDKWLEVKNWNIPDDVCVVGFRGGEYYLYPELGLPSSYFYDAMIKMVAINPKMKFEIHTDDPIKARHFFPMDTIVHDMALNWRAMRYAKYAIIANSSFYILPRLLRDADASSASLTIAPRYWARRNTQEWSMPQNFYKSFFYV